MSFLSVSTDGYLQAEATQQAYIDESMRAYSQAKKEIDGLLKESYAKLAGIDPASYWAEMTKYERYKKLSEGITDSYKNASKLSGKSIEAGLSSAMNESYNRQLYLFNWITAELPAVPLNEDLLKYSITGNIDIWKKIQKQGLDKIYGSLGQYTPQAGTLTQLLTKNYTAELDRILQSVQNGFITGKSYTNQSKAIAGIIGKYIKSTDTGTGVKYNALRTARTEGNRVLNAGSLANANRAASLGIDMKKEWLSTLDTRTRSGHQSLDGQRRDLDKPFQSSISSGQAPGQMGAAADNINCRCTTIMIVDNTEPTVRRGRNPETGKNEVISFVSYNQWAKDNGIA
jgi:hypothetical protein